MGYQHAAEPTAVLYIDPHAQLLQLPQSSVWPQWPEHQDMHRADSEL